ncbi:MAG: DUF4190 domain-containing protein [Actinobacteria bacterium]|nr:DUF4190 domain-containing protein [Actinomycetota bacterium]
MDQQHVSQTSQAPAPQPVYVTAAKTDGMSIASLVLAIVGAPTSFIGIGWLLEILAIIFGHLARKNIRIAQPPGSLGGDGLALAGLIIGYIVLGLYVFILLIFGSLIMAIFGGGRHI